ncbi:hypothetical protein DUI87_05992 [Hirundo rustica rustica]|uniref:Uncharacterized protein n=1 Tax=Hirundo rustica rustica TaxID=333673 RepID=A0A3M0KXI9_HIRRU|nr:hypothetical protein DUI87_05992 [Hirundo rustica rustica]
MDLMFEVIPPCSVTTCSSIVSVFLAGFLQVNILPVLELTELDSVLKVGFYQSGVEEQNTLPHPVAHAALDSLQQVNILPVLELTELDSVLKVGFYQSGVEEQNTLPHPVAHAALDAV